MLGTNTWPMTGNPNLNVPLHHLILHFNQRHNHIVNSALQHWCCIIRNDLQWPIKAVLTDTDLFRASLLRGTMFSDLIMCERQNTIRCQMKAEYECQTEMSTGTARVSNWNVNWHGTCVKVKCQLTRHVCQSEMSTGTARVSNWNVNWHSTCVKVKCQLTRHVCQTEMSTGTARVSNWNVNWHSTCVKVKCQLTQHVCQSEMSTGTASVSKWNANWHGTCVKVKCQLAQHVCQTEMSSQLCYCFSSICSCLVLTIFTFCCQFSVSSVWQNNLANITSGCTVHFSFRAHNKIYLTLTVLCLQQLFPIKANLLCWSK